MIDGRTLLSSRMVMGQRRRAVAASLLLLSLRLLLVVVAASGEKGASSSGGGPSFWAMDPRLMSPPHPLEPPLGGATFREQAATERAVWERFQQRQQQEQQQEQEKSEQSGPPALPFPLHTARHVALLTRVLESFPERLPAAYAASVPWCFYWCLHALDVLGAAASSLTPALRARILGTLRRCQQPDGGFAGLLDAPFPSSSHILSTYAALATVAILHHHHPSSSRPPIRSIISKRRLRAFLLSLKHPTDGTFRATPAPDAETDARSVWGALAVARLGGLLDGYDDREGEGKKGAHPPPLIEREKLVAYLTALQTHEGGFAGEPGDDEAHAGFSYCTLAALRLLGAVDRVRDPGGLRRWVAQRQRAFEGGCSGRTNKLVDACYSFWVGAAAQLSLKEDDDGHSGGGKNRWWLLHAGALARYLLAVSQDAARGGFADKPGAAVDYYHTCYALSGLALAAHGLGSGGSGGDGNGDNDPLLLSSLWEGLQQVRPVDQALNLCVETLAAWDAARPLID